MDNVLIDDRRIHVDFCQSVAKVKWKKSGMMLILFLFSSSIHSLLGFTMRTLTLTRQLQFDTLQINSVKNLKMRIMVSFVRR